jgi:hypothetical protein
MQKTHKTEEKQNEHEKQTGCLPSLFKKLAAKPGSSSKMFENSYKILSNCDPTKPANKNKLENLKCIAAPTPKWHRGYRNSSMIPLLTLHVFIACLRINLTYCCYFM